jgi:hypothetical protein
VFPKFNGPIQSLVFGMFLDKSHRFVMIMNPSIIYEKYQLLKVENLNFSKLGSELTIN